MYAPFAKSRWLLTFLYVVAAACASNSAWADDKATCKSGDGDPSLAIAACTRLIRTTSDKEGLALLYSGRGFHYRRKRDYQAAIKDKSTAIQFKDFGFLYWHRGAIYHDMGKYDLALKDYATALVDEERPAGILIDRAKTYEAMGRVNDAVADYRRVYAACVKYTPPVAGCSDDLKRLGASP